MLAAEDGASVTGVGAGAVDDVVLVSLVGVTLATV